VKVDLHIHTADDQVDRLKHSGYDVVNRATELGFGALAITLHETQLVDRRLTAYARERGITLISGIERTIEGKHVLLLNFPVETERIRTFAELGRLKVRSSGLVIAPHPFFPGPRCVGGLLDRHAALFDAVEYSYFHTPWANFNRAAGKWAREHGKPLVGNSDLHDLRQMGRTFSDVDVTARDAGAICDAIRCGRVSVRTSPVPAMELAQVLGGMFLGQFVPRRATIAPADIELAS
jgi:predicted metal-dependent phosphoesterase TrpH